MFIVTLIIMTTTIDKWFVFNLGITICHEITRPTGPWLDNGPPTESWYVIERGGLKRKLSVKKRCAYDDGGSEKIIFDSEEYLFIPCEDIGDEGEEHFEKLCDWCGMNAYKISARAH